MASTSSRKLIIAELQSLLKYITRVPERHTPKKVMARYEDMSKWTQKDKSFLKKHLHGCLTREQELKKEIHNLKVKNEQMGFQIQHLQVDNRQLRFEKEQYRVRSNQGSRDPRLLARQRHASESSQVPRKRSRNT